jgi:peptide subunit release factor 1 (eRF1)
MLIKASNLNRRFAVSLTDMLRSIKAPLDDKQMQSFAADAERVQQFVAGFEPEAKGLTIFCDDSDNFWWARTLNVVVHNHAQWGDTAYMLLLLAVLDGHERYGAILVDKAQARLFTVFLGEIEEHREAFAPAEVKHIQTTGSDRIWSQKRFQRKAETHARWHLKQVAELLDSMVEQYGFDRLVLAGAVEATSALYHLLPKRLRWRVVGRTTLPMAASAHEVLAATLREELQVERHSEQRLVEELLAADAPHRVTTLGLASTVHALGEGRIWRLVYASGFRARGGQCPNCAMLYARTDGACEYCGAAIEPVDGLVERMAAEVLKHHGKVEEVAGEAALRLQQAGGIGAVLRF